MKLKHIIDIIESVAPLSQQETWDNSGLQIGHLDADITSVLCCTDVTEAVMDEAIQKGCSLVLSHHPLLFHGLKSIQGQTFQERVVEKAIRHGVAIYSSHTAMDTWLYGVSGRMADKIGLQSYRILVPTVSDGVGLGVIGTLSSAMPREAFLEHLKEVFSPAALRYSAAAPDTIRTVALCGGAGGEFFEQAIAAGADAYVSAEFKHHEWLAASGRILLCDLGHYESEQYTKEVFASLLAAETDLEILLSEETSPTCSC